MDFHYLYDLVMSGIEDKLFDLFHDPLSSCLMPMLYQWIDSQSPEKLSFIPHALRMFYSNGFEENDTHRRWSGLWRKQFKLRLYDRTFISLNKLRPRLTFQNLKRYSVRFAPVNLYMSTLNWLMPERVAEKSKANHA